MFAALINEGERVRLPSGKTGTVVGRSEDRRVIVMLDGGTGEDDTVSIYAKHLQRVHGPQPTEGYRAKRSR